MKKRINIIIVLVSFIALLLGILMIIFVIKRLDLVKGSREKAGSHEQNSLNKNDPGLRTMHVSEFFKT